MECRRVSTLSLVDCRPGWNSMGRIFGLSEGSCRKTPLAMTRKSGSSREAIQARFAPSVTLNGWLAINKRPWPFRRSGIVMCSVAGPRHPK